MARHGNCPHIAMRCVQNVAASFVLATLVVLPSAVLLTRLWLHCVLPAPRKVVSRNFYSINPCLSLYSGVQYLVSRRGVSDSSIPLLTVEGVVRGFFGKQ